MADYRKLASDLVVADGQIDDTELKLLRKHLYADGKIEREEVDFLMEVRAAVLRKAKDEASVATFDKFLLKAVGDYLEKTGKVNDADLALIKKIAADKRISDAEKKKFLAKATKDTKENASVKKVHDDFVKKSAAAK